MFLASQIFISWEHTFSPSIPKDISHFSNVYTLS